MTRSPGRLVFLSGLFTACWVSSGVSDVWGAEAARPRLGMNLNGPADWNTELPFVDVFRLSRRWISQRKAEGWGRGPALDLDQHGWVKRLEPDCWAESPLCTISDGHYPGGRYTILYDGEGELDVWNAARIVSRSPGMIVIDGASRFIRCFCSAGRALPVCVSWTGWRPTARR